MGKKIDIGCYNDDHDLAVHNSEALKSVNEQLNRLLYQLNAFTTGLRMATDVPSYVSPDQVNDPVYRNVRAEVIDSLVDISNYITLSVHYTEHMRNFIIKNKDLKLVDYQIDLDATKDELVNIYLSSDDRGQFEQKVEKYIKQKFDKYGKDENLPF